MRIGAVTIVLVGLAGILPVAGDVHFGGEETIRGGDPTRDPEPEVRQVVLHDLVTIRIADVTNFRNRLQSETDQETEIDFGFDELFNTSSRRGTDGRRSPRMNLQMERSSAGETNEQQQTRIEAIVTAEVIEARPDGNTFVIEARRVKQVDDMRTTVTLTGVIRRQDIGTDNVVGSDRVANLRLDIQNEGSSARPKRAGWLKKLIDVIWPF